MTWEVQIRLHKKRVGKLGVTITIDINIVQRHYGFKTNS